MSNDVERLRQALRDKAQEIWERGRRGAPLLSVNDAMEVLEQMGVTLPTPPRATPLEAAAAALAAFDGIARDAMMRESREIRRRGASSILAAAVGALSDEAVREVWEAYTKPSTAQDGRTAFRAALLARLTEGGN